MSENEVLFIRSSKKNLNKSSEADTSTNDEDIWDDTILVETYDKAMQLAQQSFLSKNQSDDNSANSKGRKNKNKNEQQKWKVGDKCRCQYSEDLKFYEADVIDILGSTGKCIVKYIGYGNEEKVSLKKLKASGGDDARTRQLQEALSENGHDMGVEDLEKSEDEKQSPKIPKKFNKKKKHSKDRSSFKENNNFMPFHIPLTQMGNGIIPPPPPPHMFNAINEDEVETEAMSAMLISWYMSGYHTGYYQGLKMAKKH